MRNAVNIALTGTLAWAAFGASGAGGETPGDSRHIPFVSPFEEAQAQAVEQQRLLFLKPVYGGVDQRGAEDYRCGSW